MKLNQPYYIDPREGENHIDLSGVWSFTYSDEATDSPNDLEWKYETTLPKSLYFSLYEAGILPHPYKGTNSKLYSWVDEKVWYFKKRFSLKRGEAANAFLSFEGVCYYSRLWVNGKLLGEHEGMYGGPIADIIDLLDLSGENEITVELKSANYYNKDSFYLRGDDATPQIVPWNSVRDKLSGDGDFIAMGIYNSVRLDFTDRLHISRPYLYTAEASEKKATLNLEFEIADGKIKELHPYGIVRETTCESTNLYALGFTGRRLDEKVEIRLSLREKGSGKVVFESSDEEHLPDYDNLMLRTMRFCEFMHFTKKIEIEEPHLWYPVNMGEPFLYELQIEMYSEGRLCDRQTVTTGIRTFTASRTAGPKYRTVWNDYRFRVNGKDFFLLGMNWMHIDYLLNLDPKEYEWALTLAKNAGIQLLRVWSGGAIPEADIFYELCDRLGIMIWQDHRIANTSNTSGYDQEVLESQEAYNLYRTRNHPSLVVHCGGNEFNPYHENNGASTFTITRLVKTLDPSRLYYYASPDGGSSHCYVDMDPARYFTDFAHLPLLAESGIHNFPTYHTIKGLIKESESKGVLPDILSEEFVKGYPELLHHFTEYQPDRIPRMLSRISQIDDIRSMTLEDICDAAGAQAYEFYLLMIGAMRSNYPITCGVMPWAFKRPWSTVGVQLVDGDGRPTPPYYAVKNAYSPISAILNSGFSVIAPGEPIPLKIKICNGTGRSLEGAELRITVYSPSLEPEREYVECVTAQRDDFVFESFVPDEGFRDRAFIICADLSLDGALLSRAVHFKRCTSLLADPELYREHRECRAENLSLPDGPWVKGEIKAAKRSKLNAKLLRHGKSGSYRYYDLRLQNDGDMPIYPVTFEIKNQAARFYSTDSFFLMKPDEYKEIRLVCDGLSDSEVAEIEIRAWNADSISLNI